MQTKTKKCSGSIVMSFRLNLYSDCDFLIFKVLNSISKNRRTTILKQILYNYFMRFIEKKKEQYSFLSNIANMSYEEYFKFLEEHHINNFVSKGQVLRLNAQVEMKKNKKHKEENQKETQQRELNLLDDSKILSIDDFIF